MPACAASVAGKSAMPRATRAPASASVSAASFATSRSRSAGVAAMIAWRGLENARLFSNSVSTAWKA